MESVLQFLMELTVNNNRDWFQANKERYLASKAIFDTMVDSIIDGLKLMDSEVNVAGSKQCVYRIYRDARFSRNKQPYKNNFGAFIAKDGRKSGYAGYYIHMEPDNSFVGGGVYMPASDALKSIRTDIYNDASAFKSIIHATDFEAQFNGLEGACLKRGPKGFPKDFEDMDLLKHKHYVVTRRLEDDFWTQKSIVASLLDVFRVQVPFNQYLNKAIAKTKELEDEHNVGGLDDFFL